MDLFTSILFWVGVLIAADGSLALVFEEKWQKIVRGVRIRRLALMECGIGFLLLALHYILRTAW